MVLSLLLAISCVACLITLLSFPLSQSVFRRIPICVLIEIGFCCCILGLSSFFHIGYSSWLVIVSNCILIILVLVSLQIKPSAVLPVSNNSKIKLAASRLRPLATRNDIVFLILLLVITLSLSFLQFGFPVSITFITADPSEHFAKAMRIFNGGIVSGQYLVQLTAAIFMSFFEPFVASSSLYEVYIWTEIGFFTISGWMFYSLITRFSDKERKLTICIIFILYIIGYPLNNLIMGFSYLGASVTVIAALLYMLYGCSPDNKTEYTKIAIISVLLLELSISYLVFVPPVFTAIFIFYIYALKKKKEKNSVIFLEIVAVFSLPCLFAFFVSLPAFLSIPSPSSDTANAAIYTIKEASAALRAEGGSFRELYANFIFILPLSIYGYLAVYNKKSFQAINMISIAFIAWTVLLFIAGIVGMMSSYYFFKTYYALWLLFFVYAYLGVNHLQRESPKMLVSYSVVWIIIISLAVFGLDAKSSASRPNFNPTPVSNYLFSLYTYNASALGEGTIDRDLIQEYEQLCRDIEENGNVGILSDHNLSRWLTAYGYNSQVIPWWLASDEQDILDQISKYDEIYITQSINDRPDPNRDYSPLDNALSTINDTGALVDSDSKKALLLNVDALTNSIHTESQSD